MPGLLGHPLLTPTYLFTATIYETVGHVNNFNRQL